MSKIITDSEINTLNTTITTIGNLIVAANS
jgi:hypothetical protein